MPVLLTSSLVWQGVLAAEVQGDIVVTGAERPVEDNLRAHLGLQGETCDSSLSRLQRLQSPLRRRLVQALNALGYYHGNLSLEFSRTESCWRLVIDVSQGQPTLLRSVDVQILGTTAEQEHFRRELAGSTLLPQSVLNHGAYEAFKDALASTAADQGFFDARFTASVIALDLPARAADITLIFDPGERYHFGPITIDRPGILSEELILNLLPVKEGDPYSADSLVAMRSALDGSSFFNQIAISPRIGQVEDRAVPVDLVLGLRARHKWTSGLGFTTDTGPRARLEYENRYINSKGHRFDADTSLSSVRGQINGRYSIPLNKSFADDLVFTAGYIAEDFDAYISKRIQTGISLPSENRYGWQQNLTLDFQRDDYELASRVDVSSLVIPGISLSKTRSDNPIYPQRGWKLLSVLKGSGDALLSDATFVQFYSSAKLVQSLGPFRFLSRAEVGATWIDESNDLPASLRFFAGGDQSVRGYDFRSLGPLDPVNSEVTGGKQLLTGSVEMDYLLRPNWRVALFMDAGNAFNASTGYELKHSAGIGIRWLSPIGPVRFDLAHPFDADDSFRIHITMGPDL